MPLPEIWSGVSNQKKEDWTTDECTKAFLIEIIRLAQHETAHSERYAGMNPPLSAYHVCRASGMREIARIIQGVMEHAGTDDDDEETEGR